MTVSPSVISRVMLRGKVAMAACSGDIVGYVCVMFLMKLALFDPMLMRRLLTSDPCAYRFLTDSDTLI